MDMKSKLKFPMPNVNGIVDPKSATCWMRIAVFRSLYLPILLISIVNCVELSSQLGDSVTPAGRTINETTPKFDRGESLYNLWQE